MQKHAEKSRGLCKLLHAMSTMKPAKVGWLSRSKGIPVPEIVNVVVVVWYRPRSEQNFKLDLFRTAMNIPCLLFNPKNFAANRVRLYPVTALLFSSFHMSSVAYRTYHHALWYCHQYRQLIEQTEIVVRDAQTGELKLSNLEGALGMYEFEVQNKVGNIKTFNMEGINLKKVLESKPSNCSWTPSNFPGLIYRDKMRDPYTRKMLDFQSNVFDTGKAVLMATTNYANLCMGAVLVHRLVRCYEDTESPDTPSERYAKRLRLLYGHSRRVAIKSTSAKKKKHKKPAKKQHGGLIMLSKPHVENRSFLTGQVRNTAQDMAVDVNLVADTMQEVKSLGLRFQRRQQQIQQQRLGNAAGMPILIRAALNGQLRNVSVLLQKGHSPKAKDSSGMDLYAHIEAMSDKQKDLKERLRKLLASVKLPIKGEQ